MRHRLAAGLTLLADKPDETIDNTLHALWHAASGHPVSAVTAPLNELPALDAHGARVLEALVQRRLDGVPLAHLVGRQHFMGMDMLAGPEALVPRRETELLARAAIDLATAAGDENGHPLVVDVCTGCGNLALAVARHVPGARVFGADLSDAAIELARRNAEHLGLGQRVEFRTGDLLTPFESAGFLGCTDLIICNPPYITSSNAARMAHEISAHEPRLAFDGGPLGVAIVMRLLDEAPRFLRSGGHLAFEVGSGQGAALVRRLERVEQFRDIRALDDENGVTRCIVCCRD